MSIEIQNRTDLCPPQRSRTVSWEKWLGLLLALAAFVFFYFSVLDRGFSKGNSLDLSPYPDAAEYFAVAKSISQGKAPQIQIGFESLPSRYPSGFSVCMLPWLKMLKNHPVWAPFRTNQTVGLLLLAAFWFWRRKEPIVGGATILLLATLPCFVTYCRSSMSEICGAAMVCGAFLCAYRGVVKNKALPVYLSAVMLGLAVSIRIQLVFFAPALIAMALIDFQGRWGKWLGHCAAALGVFFLAASPMFILNWTQFGNPLATGYHFWVPSATEHGAAFSTRYFLPSIAVLWREFSQSTTAYSVAHIFGSGVHFVPAFALLAAVGLFYVRNRKVAVVAAFGCITYACAALFYFYNDIRMYVPLLILMALPAGLATGRAIESIIRGRNVVMSIVIVILFLGAVIGYPSQAGFLQKSGQIQALYSLGIIPHRDGGKPRAYTAAMEMAKRYRDQPGIVLSFINPVFLNSVLPNGFTAAPVNGVHEYSHSRQWRYGSKDAAALARRGSEESLPVYALLTNNEKLKEEQEQLPSVPGWTWREVPANKEKAVILKLQPLTDLKNPASSRGK